MEKSNLEVAYDLMLNREAMAFQDLWSEICQIQGYSEEEAKDKIGKFYTNLFMDGRFVVLSDNKWDLRDRYAFEKIHIDMNECYPKDDEQEAKEEEVKELSSEEEEDDESENEENDELEEEDEEESFSTKKDDEDY